MWVFRAPTSLLQFAAYGCAALVALVVWAVLQVPVLDVDFAPTSDGSTLVTTADGELLGRVPPGGVITFTGVGGVVSETASHLADGFTPDGSLARQAELYARRDDLAAMADAGPMRLDLPGQPPRSVDLTPADREFVELGLNFWLLVLTGVASFLVGVWVWALRPRDWGARMFAISGAGLMLSALPGAVFQTQGIAANGAVLWAMAALNLGGSQLCGAGLIGQALCYPRALVPPRRLLLIPLVIVPLVAATLLGWLSLQVLYAAMLVEFLVLIALMIWQWRLARLDPMGRAALRWIALSTLLGTSGFVIVNVAPTLLGQPMVTSDGVAFLFLSVIYGGMALGVGRYRLFDLDRWAYRIMLAIIGSLALLLLDGLLVFGLRFQTSQALGISLAAIGLIYLPLRSTLLSWLTRRPSMSPSEVLQAAEEVRFTPDIGLRRNQWRALLQKLFDPLELSTTTDVVTSPALRLDGLELLVPATAGENALILRYPSKGRALFSAPQLALVDQLVGLMQRAESVREGYARGVAEERRRIAQDLHDDVSGRLLTSLYRPDAALIREDVRTAMADLRTIMRGLAGDQLSAPPP